MIYSWVIAWHVFNIHYSDALMSAMAPRIISVLIVFSTVNSGADRGKHQSSASLAFVRGIHWSTGDSPHKGPVTRKMFPFDDVIMNPSSRPMLLLNQWPIYLCCYFIENRESSWLPYVLRDGPEVVHMTTKQPWRIWINKPQLWIVLITTTIQNKTKSPRYSTGYTISC